MVVLLLVAYVYYCSLCGWVIAQVVWGDRWWWLFLLNSFAVYLFLPLPGVVVVALLSRRPELWAASLLAVTLALYRYGRLFLPKKRQAEAGERKLTIMTYNLLGHNLDSEAPIAAMCGADVDVIALQELNPAVATAVRTKLMDRFPYQVLDPQHGVTGLGVMSRYPLWAISQQFPGAWLGSPQVVRLDYHGTPVTLVNVHCASVEFDGWKSRAKVEWSVQERERQATMLANFAATQPGPLIALGDFNTTEQSTAYKLITKILHDAWRAAGFGLGHTFPGGASPSNARPLIAGIAVPMWLIRIDYIFYSSHWQPLAAWLGRGSGSSDHRPVVAQLALPEKAS